MKTKLNALQRSVLLKSTKLMAIFLEANIKTGVKMKALVKECDGGFDVTMESVDGDCSFSFKLGANITDITNTGVICKSFTDNFWSVLYPEKLKLIKELNSVDSRELVTMSFTLGEIVKVEPETIVSSPNSTALNNYRIRPSGKFVEYMDDMVTLAEYLFYLDIDNFDVNGDAYIEPEQIGKVLALV